MIGHLRTLKVSISILVLSLLPVIFADAQVPKPTLIYEKPTVPAKLTKKKAINLAKQYTGFKKAKVVSARYLLVTDTSIPFLKVIKRPAWELVFTGVEVFITKGDGTKQKNPNIRTITLLIDAKTGALLKVSSLFDADTVFISPETGALLKICSPKPAVGGLNLLTGPEVEKMLTTNGKTLKNTTTMPSIPLMQALTLAKPALETKEVVAYFGLYTDVHWFEKKIKDKPCWIIIMDGITMLFSGPPGRPDPDQGIGETMVVLDAQTGEDYGSFHTAKPTPIYMLSGYIRKVSDLNPGTLHVFRDWTVSDLDPDTVHVHLYNSLEKPLGIQKIWLNHLDTETCRDLFYWSQVVPNPIPPGMVGDLMIKLKMPLAAPLHINFTTTDKGSYIGVTISKRVPEVKITYVAFSEDLKKVYLYCKNIAQKELLVRSIEILPISNKVDTIKYIPSNRLKPDELYCMVINLQKPLRQGQFIWCAVKTGDHNIAGCAVTRVYTHFPIQAFGNDHRPELFFDQDNFEMPYPGSEDQWNNAQNQQWYKAYHVLEDPIRADYGSGTTLGLTAQEVISRADTCRKRDAVHPTIIYMSESMMLTGYFVYGEITDLVAINPRPILDGESLWGNPDHVLLAKLATEPRPLYTIPEAFMVKDGIWVSERYPTPEEERLTVYLQLAYGSKGIWYYCKPKASGGYEGYPALQEEIGKINSELRVLRPYLKISEPVDWAKSLTPETEAYALLCADRGIIVIIINMKFRSFPRQKDNPFSYQPAGRVKVKVAVPEALKINRAQVVSEGYRKEVSFTKAGKYVEFTINNFELVTPVLLIP